MELDTLSFVLLSCIGAIALYSARNSKGPDIHPLLLSSQSSVNQIREPGESAIYRSKYTPRETPLLACSDRNIRTLYEAFRLAGLKNGGAFLGTRGENGYEYQTYAAVAQRVNDFGAGLINLTNLKVKSENIVGIYMQNSAETLIADLAAHHYSLVSLPIQPAPHDVLPSNFLDHILKHTELSVIVVSKANLSTVLSIAPVNKHLEAVIVVGHVTEDDREAFAGLRIKLWSFEEVEENGRVSPVEHVAPAPEDLAVICYTSGTTAKPKGVMLTHENIIAGVSSAIAIIPPNQKLTPDDRHLSYLTLGHVYERIMTYHIIMAGGQIAFYSGDTGKILEDAELAKPTIFASVPTVLIRIRSQIEKNYGKSFLYKRGYESKLQLLNRGQLVRDEIWDLLAFRKIRKLFGGSVRILAVSGEPIHPDVITFYRIVLGAQVIHAYGLTETSGGATSTILYDYSVTGAVGAPMPANEIKLIDVPELGYRAEDTPNPRGEVCIRGYNVMKGYWRDENETRKVVDADGWLHTDDIGEILPTLALKIVDRKKNLISRSK